MEHDSAKPIPVVMFGSGPALTQDAKKFLCLLENHPGISLLAAFCQADSQTFRAIVKDLWYRRGILAMPLLLARIVDGVGRFLTKPRAEIDLNRQMSRLSNRIHFVKDIHGQSTLDHVYSLNPMLGLIYGSPILRPELFEIPVKGTLGIHHGKVPEYRGNKTTFWAMYNGEDSAGVTIQKVNVGLDTGEIVKQGEVPIGRRSQRSVWLELEALGLDLYIQAILEIKEGKASFRPQIGPKRKPYRNPKASDILRFWGKLVRRRASIFDLRRST